MAINWASKTHTKPSIKMMIHKRMAYTEPARGFKRIHASDLTKPGFCPRMVRLLDVTGKKIPGEFISTALRLTFDHGNDTNKHIAENWLVDVAVGDWHCMKCGFLHEFRRRPKICSCGCKNFEYREVRFESKECGASCGVDILVDTGEAKLRVVEVKTIDKDYFKSKDGKTELLAPMAEHKLRTTLYLRIIADSDHPKAGFINTQEAFVLYKSKGYGCKDTSLSENGVHDAPFSPFKEFTVCRDDNLTDTEWVRALVIKKARENGTMPSGKCTTAFCDGAKGCPVAKACFSGKYPATKGDNNE